MLNSIQLFNYQINQRQTMPKTVSKPSFPVLSQDTVSFSGGIGNTLYKMAQNKKVSRLDKEAWSLANDLIRVTGRKDLHKLFIEYYTEVPAFKRALELVKKEAEKQVCKDYEKINLSSGEFKNRVNRKFADHTYRFMRTLKERQEIWPENIRKEHGSDFIPFLSTVCGKYPKLVDQFTAIALEKKVISKEEYKTIKARVDERNGSPSHYPFLLMSEIYLFLSEKGGGSLKNNADDVIELLRSVWINKIQDKEVIINEWINSHK